MFAEIQIPYLKEVFYTTIIALVAFIISRAIKNRIFKILDTLPQNLRKGVVSVFNLAIYLLATFAILNVWGIDLGNILLSLGVFSIALSFALKNTIENLVSGVLLTLDRPFKIGDEIEVKGIRGRVKKIAIRYTIISTNDCEVFIPSKVIANEPLKNFSAKSIEKQSSEN